MGRKERIKEFRLYGRNFQKFGLDLNPTVSVFTIVFIFLFAGYAIINIDSALDVFSRLYDSIVSGWDWIFLLGSNFFIVVCIYLAVSKTGNVRIGGMSAKPEFSTFGWYSMLISAGMGIGLMFWSVGEPLIHSQQAPFIFQSNNPETTALATTFFHWGIHPWAIYALLGLSLAFFAYNKNLPLSLRSIFYPIFKDRIFGEMGDFIDILAVISCIFGLATSLGLGVLQMNSGLNYLFNIPEDVSVQLILIVLITMIAMISIIAGVYHSSTVDSIALIFFMAFRFWRYGLFD